MDGVLDKIGLYDFFGYLIPGMCGTFAYYFLNMEWSKDWEGFVRTDTGSTTGNIILFLVASYLLGLAVHEIGSWLDRKFKWGYKPIDELPPKDFDERKSYLEIREKDNQFQKMDSMFALSRSLMTMFLILFFVYLTYIVCWLHNFEGSVILPLILTLCITAGLPLLSLFYYDSPGGACCLFLCLCPPFIILNGAWKAFSVMYQCLPLFFNLTGLFFLVILFCHRTKRFARYRVYELRDGYDALLKWDKETKTNA